MATQKPKRVVIKRTRQTFSQEHKVGFILVAGMGTLAFVLGGLYLLRHLASPFDFDYSGPRVFFDGQEDAITLQEQKKQDTDGDSLTDYDEIYVYKTSPYLKDSDGDGYTDDTEIMVGSDPNCKGEECESNDNLTDGATILGIDQVEEPVMPDTTVANTAGANAGITSGNEMLTDETVAALMALSPTEKREILLSGGLSQADVDALTDSQVEELFTEVINQMRSEQTQ